MAGGDDLDEDVESVCGGVESVCGGWWWSVLGPGNTIMLPPVSRTISPSQCHLHCSTSTCFTSHHLNNVTFTGYPIPNHFYRLRHNYHTGHEIMKDSLS